VKVITTPQKRQARDGAPPEAVTGDRKGTFEAIRHAQEKSKDPAAFSKWLEEEPAFAKFHATPEFRALFAAPPEPH
jgi:hypothetical protein